MSIAFLRLGNNASFLESDTFYIFDGSFRCAHFGGTVDPARGSRVALCSLGYFVLNYYFLFLCFS